MSAAQFTIMVQTAEGHRAVGTFYAKDEKALLVALAERLPSLNQDHALVALNEAALTMLLKASSREARQ